MSEIKTYLLHGDLLVPGVVVVRAASEDEAFEKAGNGEFEVRDYDMKLRHLGFAPGGDIEEDEDNDDN